MTVSSPQASCPSQSGTTTIRALLARPEASGPLTPEQVHEREELLQRILDSSEDCIKLLDLEGRLLFMNAGGQRLMELSSFEAVRAAQWQGFWRGEDHAAATAAVAAARVGGTGCFTGFCPTNAGRPKWWEVVVTPIRDAAGHPERLLAISRDVTSRRERLDLIKRLNRTHAMLSGINQLIVHERTAQAILDGACRVAVEKGGFRLAWVGLADGPDGRFRLAAHAGATPDTVAAIEATLQDPQRGCAVTAKVMDTAQPCCCNDIQHDPIASPWRAAALARGYRAMVSFPLTREGRATGTFNLYAGEPEAFNAEELHLLEELASDIAFALDGCEREQARRRAEEELRASEERFRQFAENIDEVFWITDPAKNQMIYISPAYETIWGRTCASLYASPRDWLEAIHPEDRPRVLHAATTRQQTGTYDEEYRITRPDGAVRWIRDQAFPVRDAAGTVQRIVGLARDITERKLAALALQESRQMLEKAQRVAHIGSWVSDPGPQGGLIWSAETERIFGFAPGEPDGRVETFFALVHPEDREAVARASRAALAGECAYDLEHRIVRRDGQTRWVHEQADVERDAAGQPLRMVGVVQDITERKQLEGQLRAAQKMEAIGRLAGGIAHDFNNILGAILGNAELMKLHPAGSLAAEECLSAILDASHRAKDLVRQILAFSRRQEQKRQPMQLNLVVKEALKLLRASVPADIEFRTSIPVTPTVLADPSEIHQVTMNLCTNAWHAMKDRPGAIMVALAETEVDRAFARLHPDLRPGRYVRLTVADNGCGMSAATLERIFEPFFTTKPVGQGTGLGLAVVHGIIKSHDGGIVVESQPDVGTTFHVYFPVFEAEVIPTAPEPKPTPRGRGEHILFVDDEEPLAKMGKAALERLGYRVTEHTCPTAALAAFRTPDAEFDLVITDYNMPGINGASFGEQVLKTKPGQRLLLTSGYSATINGETVRALGFSELMPKPYDLRTLGEAVCRVLSEAKSAP